MIRFCGIDTTPTITLEDLDGNTVIMPNRFYNTRRCGAPAVAAWLRQFRENSDTVEAVGFRKIGLCKKHKKIMAGTGVKIVQLKA